VSEFSVDWLALRGDADVRARDACMPLLWSLRRWLAARRPARIVDLGCGSGANLRYLGPRLGGAQRWHCIDQDAALLAALMRQCGVPGVTACPGNGSTGGPGWRARLRLQHGDLAAPIRAIRPDSVDLVTASALLDLVSGAWLAALAARCAAAGAAVLFSLSVDGEFAIRPREDDDAWLLALVRRHQHRDKGLGTALGPTAAKRASRCLQARGYRVRSRRSDWLLDATDGALQRALLAGWVEAALEVAPAQAARLRRWQEIREAHLRAGRSCIRVGHRELLALPPT
jgi:SAM-dependent methyltransferase